MRFLLVRPHVSLHVARCFHAFLHLEPLDLETVAAGIPAGHEVRILDLTLGPQPERDFLRELGTFKPHVVGFGGYSSQAASVKHLARLAKERDPAVRVLAGGVHATIAPEDYRLPGTIDLVVRGEGATAMQVLAPLLESGAAVPASDRFLPTDAPDFAACAALPPPALPEYDVIPRPRRDLVDRRRYFCVWAGRPRERVPTLFPQVATMRTSVGCPHRCNFCVVHFLARGKYVQRTPEDVVNEIASLAEDHIYFVDDEMFVNAGRTEAIARLLQARGIRKRYISWARSDTICRHPELFKLWHEVGLEVVYVGMESMRARDLDYYHKGYEPDANLKAVAILRETGLILHAALMVRPEFEAADFLELREAMKSVVPAEISFTVFSPPPGTDLWREHRDRFICPDPHAFYDCMHTLLPTKLPLRLFYRYFALLYLFGFRQNPWRTRRIRAPLRDVLRMFVSGARCGHALRTIYKDYDRSLW